MAHFFIVYPNRQNYNRAMDDPQGKHFTISSYFFTLLYIVLKPRDRETSYSKELNFIIIISASIIVIIVVAAWAIKVGQFS